VWQHCQVPAQSLQGSVDNDKQLATDTVQPHTAAQSTRRTRK